MQVSGELSTLRLTHADGSCTWRRRSVVLHDIGEEARSDVGAAAVASHSRSSVIFVAAFIARLCSLGFCLILCLCWQNKFHIL